MPRTHKGSAVPEDGATPASAPPAAIAAIADGDGAPLGYRLMAVAHIYDNRLGQALRAKNPAMTVPRMQALQLINANPGVSGAELARAMYVKAQSITGMLAAMNGLGWIGRASVPGNGRVVENTITATGKTELRSAVRTLNKLEKRLADAYSHDGREQRALAELLTLGRCAIEPVLR
jgi:DNA-binding MarR family transcriptional regulator